MTCTCDLLSLWQNLMYQINPFWFVSVNSSIQLRFNSTANLKGYMFLVTFYFLSHSTIYSTSNLLITGIIAPEKCAIKGQFNGFNSRSSKLHDRLCVQHLPITHILLINLFIYVVLSYRAPHYDSLWWVDFLP